jgi:hypothetical protein
MAAIKLNNVTAISETGGVATFGSPSATLVYPAGMIIQTEYDVYVSSEGFTSATFADSQLSLAITPKRTGSKMLIMTDVKVSWDNGIAQTGMKITRQPAAGTEVDVTVGETSGSRIPTNQHFYIGTDSYSGIPFSTILLDSLTVTKDLAITYTVKISNLNANGTIYINRGADQWGDSTNSGTPTSSLTVMEVAQ